VIPAQELAIEVEQYRLMIKLNCSLSVKLKRLVNEKDISKGHAAGSVP
tara:strand:+ start:1170 stop:1313 length:144 start_codon:yes stop_codon:yes gene_type:complete